MNDYVESIQTYFEEFGHDIPCESFCEDLVNCIRAVDEHQSYSLPSSSDCESNEIAELKRKIEKLENEKEEGWNAFRNNVANRNNCEHSSIDLNADGSAFIRN